MGVQVDEAGRYDEAVCVDGLLGEAIGTPAYLGILPSLIHTSARYLGTRVPSTTVPPLIRISISAIWSPPNWCRARLGRITRTADSARSAQSPKPAS